MTIRARPQGLFILHKIQKREGRTCDRSVNNRDCGNRGVYGK